MTKKVYSREDLCLEDLVRLDGPEGSHGWKKSGRSDGQMNG